MKIQVGGIPTLILIPETDEEKVICSLLDGRFLRAYQCKSPGSYYDLSLTVTSGDIEVRRVPQGASYGY